MISFSRAGVERALLQKYRELLAASFGSLSRFGADSLYWLYAKNPAGSVVGFDAYDGDILAAHYVCIPAVVSICGKESKVLLSLNTATHPRYQGKGLFVKLAEMTYQEASDAGFCAVYGVANANSTPGFVRKLGFQLVEPLRAMVGFGSLGIDFSVVAREPQFVRVWNDQALAWRLANPVNPVRLYSKNNSFVFQAKTLCAVLPVHAEYAENFTNLPCVSGHMSPARLYLGLVPEGSCRFSGYFSIPQRFRPSPLNFIFRDLTGRGDKICSGQSFFSFLDFDAY